MSEMSNDLTTRSLTITPSTADDATRSVEAVLATDSPVEMGGWDPYTEVLDMHGADLPEYLPVCDSHSRSSIHDVLGHVEDIHIDGGRMVGRIYFAADAQPVYEKYRDGHARDVSVGYRILDKRDIKAGETEIVNGRSYTAPENMPLRVSTKWELKELSCTAIGADRNAKTRSCAEGLKPMPEEQTTTVLEERTLDPKVELAIRKVLDKYPDGVNQELRTRALSGEMDENQVRAAILDAIDAKLYPQGPAGIDLQFGFQMNPAVHRSAQLLPETFDGARALSMLPYEEQSQWKAALEKTQGQRGLTYSDIAKEVLRAAGLRVPGSRERAVREVLTRAESTLTFSDILSGSVRMSLLKGLAESEDTTRFLPRITAPDFETQKRVKYGPSLTANQLAPGGQAHHTYFADESETYRVYSFAQMFQVGIETLAADHMGAITDAPYRMGAACMRSKLDFVWSAILANANAADGTAFFHGDHNNLGTTGTALSATALEAQIAALQSTRVGQTVLGLRAKTLVVPSALYFLAAKIVSSSQRFEDSGDGAGNPLNVLGLDIISEERLSADGVVDPRTGVTHSGSNTAYYLFSTQNSPSIEIVHLAGGDEIPALRTFSLDRGEWGIGWDVRLDVGLSMTDWRCSRKCTGAS